MAAPTLFFKEPSIIIAECKTLVESFLGKSLLPGQPEMQIVLAFANRESMLRSQGDYVLSQNLVDFATSPMLDYLAANAGVTRLGATPAEVDILYTTVAGHGGVTVPAGTRVATTDGKVMFATDIEVNIAPGVISAFIPSTATVDGVGGNAYAPGTVSVIVDALPFIQSATNMENTGGGASIESDEGLRQRIKIAPSQYSTAGSVGAYRYHAFSANPSIIDVAVVSPEAGVVNVYPLISGGVDTPDAILDAVQGAVSADTVRPLTDTVNVYSPEKVTYTLTINIVLKYGAVQSTTVQRVTNAIDAYCTSKANRLGEDITVSQLTAAAMNENVHSINFVGFTDLIVNPISFPVCTGIFLGTVTTENPNA